MLLKMAWAQWRGVLLAASILLGLSGACESRSSIDGGSGGAGGKDGGAGGWGGYCHHDCFGRGHCEPDGGEVWMNDVAPIWCDDWDPAVGCGHHTMGVCTKGCVSTAPSLPPYFPTCWQRACVENAPKVEGSSCADDSDCRPTANSARACDGHSLVGAYLRCDVDAGACVPGTAPAAPADWLASCRPATGGGWGPATACSGGICVENALNPTVYGCSMSCAGDNECPSGARCRFPDTNSDDCMTGHCYPLAWEQAPVECAVRDAAAD